MVSRVRETLPCVLSLDETNQLLPLVTTWELYTMDSGFPRIWSHILGLVYRT